MRYVLDTSALLAHHRQEFGWERVQALFEAEEAELMLASVSLTEFGRRLHELGFDEAAVEETLSAYQLLFAEVVQVDAAVARAAFVVGCRTPHRLPLADALIAAAAQAREAVLVHRDEHMRQIPAEMVQQQDLAAGPATISEG
ncbi:MAG: PIN domain-containing protein [Acidobacteria bacterium]|nr:PIN domain-containing protein [Acidobacteriota bacterium]